MSATNALLYAFNRGLISVLGLARVDLPRVALSAEVFENWMPRSLGSMMLRVGTEYIGSTTSNAEARIFPFIFSATDKAIIEIKNTEMSIWVSDVKVTYGSVSTTISNSAFTSNLTSWTDNDESGAASAWKTGGYMELIGTDFAAAKRTQNVTIAGGDQNVEHGLNIHVALGPVILRVGSTENDDDLGSEISLGTGEHFLSVTPTGANMWIEFKAYSQWGTLVDSCVITTGDLKVDAPWVLADLDKIRMFQSGDVVFCAADGYKQRRIERHGTRSWSLIEYDVTDGPFGSLNVGPITLNPSDINGDITLASSAPLFKSTHVGALFEMTSIGQLVEADLSAEATFSSHIRITGKGASERTFTFIRAGTWVGTITLQRSVSEIGSWVDVTTYTTNGTTNYNDGLDDQIVYYRVGFKTGNYTSGTANLSMSYANGGLTGVLKITAFTDKQNVNAIVLKALGGADATSLWREGQWSDKKGWPSSVAIHESRLWWAGKDHFWGSVIDAYHTFDDETVGDSGPISRTVGFGAVDVINWMISIQRLLAGSAGTELSVRSDSFGTPLTPDNFNIKGPSTQGSAAINAVKVDSTAIFSQRSGFKVYELNYNFEDEDYVARDFTIHVPNIGKPAITRMAVQRQPDTRVHCVRSDGTVAVLLLDKEEEIVCWLEVTSTAATGEVIDVITLPGTEEDEVYYQVKRTINAATKYYLEKWSLESDNTIFTTEWTATVATTAVTDLDYDDNTIVTVRDVNGAKVENLTVTSGAITLSSAATYAHITPAICKSVDCFKAVSQASNVTVTGFDHLEGESITIWADGADAGTKTVSSGSITLDTAAEQIVAGLAYTAKFKSVKLAYADSKGTALIQKKKINHLGLILASTHRTGIKYGRSFSKLTNLPLKKDGKSVVANTVHLEWDQEMFPMSSQWSTDARLCLQAASPNPCTVVGAVIDMQTSDK